MRIEKTKSVIGAILWLALVFAPAGWAETFRIDDIRIEGLQRISAGTVFNFLPVQPGDTIDSSRTPEIIRSVFKTGYFKDVRLEREGGVLTILVVERPSIAELNFSGNKSIDAEALKEGLKENGLAEGRTFNRSVLDQIEQELQRQFFNQGKYGIQLTSTVTPLERNRVAIDIRIVEGETAKIKSINIIGNKSFDEEDLLDEFTQTTGNWLSFYSKDNQYSRQKLAADLETLRSFYLDRGFVNFKISSTQVTITPDKKDIFITINLEEGEIYTISDIKLAGELILPAEDYFPLIHLRRGEPFSRKEVVGSTDRVNSKLSDFGYAFANVNNIPEIDHETKTVSVTYFIDPGMRVYVRRINIKGNSRSRDRVIRREMRQQEKAWYSSEKLKLSRERIQRLGYFEDVSIETPAVPGSTDEIDIDVTVTEKPTGNILVGAGFSQSQGIIFNASVNQDNFLGTGKRVGLAFNTSDSNTQYKVSYLNPYYTVDGISRGFTLGYTATDYEDLDVANYTTDRGVASMNFGIPLSEFNRFNFGFAFEYTKFKLGASPSQEISDFEEREGDTFFDFKVNASWKHDSRDSALFPTSGGIQRLSAEATIPGSDLLFYKLNYSHRRYFPITEDLVFSANGEIGYGDGYSSTEILPFFENFYAGGPTSVRGFKANTLGPRDSDDDPLGGNVKLVGNLEVLFPPPFFDSKVARLAAFVDIGNVFDDTVDVGDLRYSAGVGGSWLSPLGALTVSYALPLNDEDGDETEEFQFNFGTTF